MKAYGRRILTSLPERHPEYAINYYANQAENKWLQLFKAVKENRKPEILYICRNMSIRLPFFVTLQKNCADPKSARTSSIQIRNHICKKLLSCLNQPACGRSGKLKDKDLYRADAAEWFLIRNDSSSQKYPAAKPPKRQLTVLCKQIPLSCSQLKKISDWLSMLDSTVNRKIGESRWTAVMSIKQINVIAYNFNW